MASDTDGQSHRGDVSSFAGVATLPMHSNDGPKSLLIRNENDDIISDTSASFAIAATMPVEIAREDEGVTRAQQQPLDESRKLFQRLWTDEDEIELLQGFLEYTNERGQQNYDTTLFYDQIRSKLQLDFNKNQLVEKLRRLKKKYRNILNRISAGKEVAFKSPHDQATFDISCKIWSPHDEDANINMNLIPSPNYNFGTYGNTSNHSDLMADKGNLVKSRKRVRIKVEEHRDFDERVVMANSGPSSKPCVIPSVIEETVKSCLSPMFKEIMDTAVNGDCGARGFGVGGVIDEKWRRQQILELEVYSMRLELVQDEFKLQLQELRSARK